MIRFDGERLFRSSGYREWVELSPERARLAVAAGGYPLPDDDRGSCLAAALLIVHGADDATASRLAATLRDELDLGGVVGTFPFGGTDWIKAHGGAFCNDRTCGACWLRVGSFARHRVGDHEFTYEEGFRDEPPPGWKQYHEDDPWVPGPGGRRCLSPDEMREAGWSRRDGVWYAPRLAKAEAEDDE